MLARVEGMYDVAEREPLSSLPLTHVVVVEYRGAFG